MPDARADVLADEDDGTVRPQELCAAGMRASEAADNELRIGSEPFLDRRWQAGFLTCWPGLPAAFAAKEKLFITQLSDARSAVLGRRVGCGIGRLGRLPRRIRGRIDIPPRVSLVAERETVERLIAVVGLSTRCAIGGQPRVAQG